MNTKYAGLSYSTFDLTDYMWGMYILSREGFHLYSVVQPQRTDSI